MNDSMRKVLIVAGLVTLLPVLGGCGEIWDMLDAGAGKKEGTKAEAAADGASSGQSPREKLDAYYNRESRKVEHDPNDPIVPCKLRGGTQYMRKNDCTLRGGSAA
jgi:hypothetical protein